MPASRFVIAQSWWIASELVRRHPKLGLAETHPGGGMYDCLSLFATDGKHRRTLIDLNRVGRLHVHVNPDFEPLTWKEVHEATDPHEPVRRIEAGTGLKRPSPTPPTSPAALSYRVIARVLASMVNEKDTWDVRSEQLDTPATEVDHAGTWLAFRVLPRSPRNPIRVILGRPDTTTGRSCALISPSPSSTPRAACFYQTSSST